MVELCEPGNEMWAVVGEQRVGDDAGLRASRFAVSVPCDDGTLVHSTLTGKLLLLGASSLGEALGDEPLRAELARRRFLVPDGTDEKMLVDQARLVLRQFASAQRDVDGYTIFTTLDCNARCFYCYELGSPRTRMGEDTAREVAAFIAGRSAGKRVKLHWFGGEPLLNAKVIDRICEGLSARGVPYSSSMVSNGYVVDEGVVARARGLWNIKKVQVTLDGTEDAYNRAKSYVGAKGSPYRRVLRNMGLLLDAGIRVSVRLNVHGGNVADLHVLAEELAGTFPGRKGLSVYAALLRDADGRPIGFAGDEDVYGRYTGLREDLFRRGLYKPRVQARTRVNHCMADADTSLTILPDGRLGKCEHFTESELVGTIREGVTDAGVVASWKERRPRSALCAACPLYPTCTDLAKCPYTTRPCNELEQRIRIHELRLRMLGSYERWRAERRPPAIGAEAGERPSS